MDPMPYKANADRRHKIPRARYRVTNWPEYDAALVRRGSLTLWVTEEALAAWHAPATGKRGGQPVYSDVAIETGLALRLVFHQPLRQTEGGFLCSKVRKTTRAAVTVQAQGISAGGERICS